MYTAYFLPFMSLHNTILIDIFTDLWFWHWSCNNEAAHLSMQYKSSVLERCILFIYYFLLMWQLATRYWPVQPIEWLSADMIPPWSIGSTSDFRWTSAGLKTNCLSNYLSVHSNTFDNKNLILLNKNVETSVYFWLLYDIVSFHPLWFEIYYLGTKNWVVSVSSLCQPQEAQNEWQTLVYMICTCVYASLYFMQLTAGWH
jgi:hypothetical protein